MWGIGGWGGSQAQASGLDANAPESCREGSICRKGGGGSGEVPTPLEIYNQKVELADGERYILIGNVVLAEEGRDRWKAYFEIDFAEHPWLATEKRKKSPFYPLEGPISYWKQFRGLRIKMPCEARGIILQREGREPEYAIQLRPTRQGVIVTLGSAR
ncbi:MAG: hypothetical protein NDJ89_09170 [Oligoflexia bacterium]|nr:hypothetical protein [Oligoflexia bacterium]